MGELPQELLEFVRHGREERWLEYKEHLEWAVKKSRAKLVKSVLGMSNIRDGGVVVIGVKNDGTIVGLPEEEAQRFTQDDVSAVVNEYAAPYAEVAVSVGTDPDAADAWVVVVQVNGFEEQPVLCRKDGHELRQGAVYTRSRRINETAEVRTEAEMRELLQLAVQKGIRAFLRSATAAGMPIPQVVPDSSRFDEQLRGL